MSSIDAIINRQFHLWEQEKGGRQESATPPVQPPRIVTISRQNGSRGAYLAGKLAYRLGYELIHREIIDAICQSSGYRKKIIEALDEHHRSRLQGVVDSLVSGEAVDHSDYVRHLYQVILSMARLGGIVLIGRGGNFILGPRRGFHIRVVCPRDRRIANLVAYKNVSAAEAPGEVDHSDAERREFIHKLFRADIDDSRHYDVVVNTDYVDVEELVPGLAESIKGKLGKLARLEREGH